MDRGDARAADRSASFRNELKSARSDEKRTHGAPADSTKSKEQATARPDAREAPASVDADDQIDLPEQTLTESGDGYSAATEDRAEPPDVDSNESLESGATGIATADSNGRAPASSAGGVAATARSAEPSPPALTPANGVPAFGVNSINSAGAPPVSDLKKAVPDQTTTVKQHPVVAPPPTTATDQSPLQAASNGVGREQLTITYPDEPTAGTAKPPPAVNAGVTQSAADANDAAIPTQQSSVQPAAKLTGEVIAAHLSARTATSGSQVPASPTDPAQVAQQPTAAAHQPTSGEQANQHSTDQRESQPQSTPAFARAVQIESAIRLENAGLNAATAESNAATASPPSVANQSALSLATALKADNPGQQLPMSSARLEENPMSAQVIRGLGAMLNQRGGAMTMRLDPPELGELRIQMTVARGIVTASFQAGTPQAQHLLEQNMATLRAALESQGMTVDRLTVSAQPSNGQQFTRDDQQMNSNHRHHHQHDAAGGESRGRRDGQPHETPRSFSMEDFEGLLTTLNRFAA